jgi:hypothetical protein
MRCLAIACLLLVLAGTGDSTAAQDRGGFKKTVFYDCMRSKDEQAVNEQLDILKTAGIAEQPAFEGALLMKKAGLVNGAKKKLDLFKSGHKKLEAAVKKDSSNAEFRFLRLMIQEHAPGLMGYKSDIARDKACILLRFDKLSPVVQQAIKEYSKESTILKPADF